MASKVWIDSLGRTASEVTSFEKEIEEKLKDYDVELDANATFQEKLDALFVSMSPEDRVNMRETTNQTMTGFKEGYETAVKYSEKEMEKIQKSIEGIKPIINAQKDEISKLENNMVTTFAIEEPISEENIKNKIAELESKKDEIVDGINKKIEELQEKGPENLEEINKLQDQIIDENKKFIDTKTLIEADFQKITSRKNSIEKIDKDLENQKKVFDELKNDLHEKSKVAKENLGNLGIEVELPKEKAVEQKEQSEQYDSEKIDKENKDEEKNETEEKEKSQKNAAKSAETQAAAKSSGKIDVQQIADQINKQEDKNQKNLPVEDQKEIRKKIEETIKYLESMSDDFELEENYEKYPELEEKLEFLQAHKDQIKKTKIPSDKKFLGFMKINNKANKRLKSVMEFIDEKMTPNHDEQNKLKEIFGKIGLSQEEIKSLGIVEEDKKGNKSINFDFYNTSVVNDDTLNSLKSVISKFYDTDKNNLSKKERNLIYQKVILATKMSTTKLKYDQISGNKILVTEEEMKLNEKNKSILKSELESCRSSHKPVSKTEFGLGLVDQVFDKDTIFIEETEKSDEKQEQQER